MKRLNEGAEMRTLKEVKDVVVLQVYASAEGTSVIETAYPYPYLYPYLLEETRHQAVLLWCIAVYCGVLWCIVVYCGVLWCSVV